jgi:pimeloyl-ACP methyl ester carboxylesterase
MGADRGMFSAPSWQSIAGAKFVDWPQYGGETTVAAIADRVIEQAAIPDGATLIGTSLGGIVACEIASRRHLKALVLVASAVRRQEIAALLAALHATGMPCPNRIRSSGRR